MPVIRFVREGRDVECYPGENLREVALREGIELYGWKGKLGNCGGCGQCITCFVELPESTSPAATSGRTTVEDQKLRGRPQNWRLACQALVQESLLVLTRPQAGMANKDDAMATALAQPLGAGPTEWPTPPAAQDEETEIGEAEPAETVGAKTVGAETDPTATSGEGS